MSEPRYPTLSIIVPDYNDKNRIVPCIESLLTQMYSSDRTEANGLKITKELLFCVR